MELTIVRLIMYKILMADTIKKINTIVYVNKQYFDQFPQLSKLAEKSKYRIHNIQKMKIKMWKVEMN